MTDKPFVLLINLGSPDEPETEAVRRYLRQFLSDRRVIETHPVVWRPILEGIILRVRPRRSAEKYRLIWGPDGAPLIRYTSSQAEHIADVLGDAAEVGFAMVYGNPSIPDALDRIHASGHTRVLVVPLYPQYSATTVAAALDQVNQWSLRSRDQLELRQVRSFPTHAGYIEALASAVEEHWADHGRPDFASGDRLVLSYHGVPTSMVRGGDPYADECRATTRALLSRLGLDAGSVAHTYQSKFGPASWLEPATIDTVANLGGNGNGRVDVVCPGFVSDCLETLEEIDIENRRAFSEAGGREFHYVPWGNARQPWLDALERVVRESLAGWVPGQG